MVKTAENFRNVFFKKRFPYCFSNIHTLIFVCSYKTLTIGNIIKLFKIMLMILDILLSFNYVLINIFRKIKTLSGTLNNGIRFSFLEC